MNIFAKAVADNKQIIKKILPMGIDRKSVV